MIFQKLISKYVIAWVMKYMKHIFHTWCLFKTFIISQAYRSYHASTIYIHNLFFKIIFYLCWTYFVTVIITFVIMMLIFCFEKMRILGLFPFIFCKYPICWFLYIIGFTSSALSSILQMKCHNHKNNNVFCLYSSW